MRDPKKNQPRDPSNNRKVRGVYKFSSTDILSEDIGQVSEEVEKRAVDVESAVDVIPVEENFKGEQLLYMYELEQIQKGAIAEHTKTEMEQDVEELAGEFYSAEEDANV